MSPLFPCAGCGAQIERATRLYLERKGNVLCSSCKDKLEADQPASAAPGTAGNEKPPT